MKRFRTFPLCVLGMLVLMGATAAAVSIAGGAATTQQTAEPPARDARYAALIASQAPTTLRGFAELFPSHR